jgi:hypothetical protein
MSALRLGPLLLIAATLVAGFQFVTNPTITWRPGIVAPDDPIQVLVQDATPLAGAAGFRITPRATFQATVRVLSKEPYWLGQFASVSPVDFAVGWGPMSDSGVLDSIRISQSGRFFFWRTDHMPVPREQIEHHAANWHMVPASRAIERALGHVHQGDIVRIEGLLVDLESPDHARMATSLTRDDTGAGACEIVWVEAVQILYR